MIWTVWAWSLMQFNFVLTASTARKQNVATTRDATRQHTKEFDLFYLFDIKIC